MEPVDVVAIAELCDALFEGDPTDRSLDPVLRAVVDDGGSLAFYEFGPVSHDELAGRVVPPPHCRALVLQCGGWMAPMPPETTADGTVPDRLRPSRHPDRRRIFTTAVIGNDAEIVSVLRVAGEPEPQVITTDCIGRVPDALRRCWARRHNQASGGLLGQVS